MTTNEMGLVRFLQMLEKRIDQDGCVASRVGAHRPRLLLGLAFTLQCTISVLLWAASGRSVLSVALLMAASGATDALFIPAYGRLSLRTPGSASVRWCGSPRSKRVPRGCDPLFEHRCIRGTDRWAYPRHGSRRALK